MKTKLLFLIFLLALAGCALDDKIPDIAEWIEFSSNPVYVLAGDEARVDISYPSTFELVLVDRDPDFTQSGWYDEGKTIMISTRRVGNTVVDVAEHRFGQKVELEIISEPFYGNYREGVITRFSVYTSDKELEERISAQILSFAEERKGIRYYFDRETNKVEIDYSGTQSGGGKVAGIYEWDIRTLTIRTDDRNEKYIFYAEYDGYITLSLDLTEYYEKEFPDELWFNVEVMIPLEKME